MKTPRLLTITLNTALDMLAVVPRVTPGGVNRSEWLGVFPGGKGVNVAKAARELGAEVTATGFVGRGPIGAALLRGLEERGVACEFVPVAGDTRPTFVLYDRAAGTETIINHPGQFALEPEDWPRLEAVVARLAGEHDFVALSGSIPEGLPPTAYRELIELIHGRGGRAALDTSGDALRLGVEAGPEIIKPTVAELLGETAIARDDPAILAAARHLRGSGAGAVIVSQGAAGVVCVWQGETFRVQPPRVEPVSTLGAGDALLAGLLCGLAQGQALPDALRLGVAAGTSSVLRYGPGECRADETEQLLGATTVTSLADGEGK